MKTWHFDETGNCGVDYTQEKQAGDYDEKHGKFRDYAREYRDMQAFLGVQEPGGKTLVDLGCGTGALALLAAKDFGKVIAVDPSEAMLARAKSKAGTSLPSMQFVRGGFLSYEHQGEPADVVVTKAALHHLPDFWKQIALLRIRRILKPGGCLYLNDVVFRFQPEDYERKIEDWLGWFEKAVGADFRPEVETHIRDEYSTFDWIMRGMLEKAGFRIEKTRANDDFLVEYHCIAVEA